ncbi:hypothetical protein CDAR_50021 [Caerostris darwini]|uniref:Uncharacterized protein n=1 Tax=Caerostris darwini TaxID=1538125 RepID=A0AAV4M6E5_9ARAC|nr:hypothetical protein CDAR_50021 [Caerostris darwini]
MACEKTRFNSFDFNRNLGSARGLDYGWRSTGYLKIMAPPFYQTIQTSQFERHHANTQQKKAIHITDSRHKLSTCNKSRGFVSLRIAIEVTGLS